MGVSPLYTLTQYLPWKERELMGFERDGIVDRSLGCTLPRFSRMRSESRVSVCQPLRKFVISLYPGDEEVEKEEELIVW